MSPTLGIVPSALACANPDALTLSVLANSNAAASSLDCRFCI
jgi:hypothetical protein